MTLVPFDHKVNAGTTPSVVRKDGSGGEAKKRRRNASEEDSVHARNIFIIQDLYRSFRDKDYAVFRALCAPDVKWKRSAGESVGENGFKSFADDCTQAGFKINRFLATDNAVLVIGRYSGRARGRETAGARGEAAHVYFLREGKITLCQQFIDTQALWEMASLS